MTPRTTSVAITALAAEQLRRHVDRADGQEDICLATYRPSTGATRTTALITLTTADGTRRPPSSSADGALGRRPRTYRRASFAEPLSVTRSSCTVTCRRHGSAPQEALHQVLGGHWSEQLLERAEIEGSSQAQQVVEPWVALALLQLPQVGAADAGVLTEDVVSPSVLDAKLANPSP